MLLLYYRWICRLAVYILLVGCPLADVILCAAISVGSSCSIFSFLCIIWQIIVCPFVLFRLGIVLSVILPFMASDYSFVIFKLF